MHAHCDECGSEIEPVEGATLVMEWRCPSCGVLDPAVYGSRCDECGTVEEWWGGDDLVCPRCLERVDEAPLAVAYGCEGKIQLSVYARCKSGQEVTISVAPIEALILGASLINYAIAGYSWSCPDRARDLRRDRLESEAA